VEHESRNSGSVGTEGPQTRRQGEISGDEDWQQKMYNILLPGFCVRRKKVLENHLGLLLLKGCDQTTLKTGGYPDGYGTT
jgi:hypothetical protein